MPLAFHLVRYRWKTGGKQTEKKSYVKNIEKALKSMSCNLPAQDIHKEVQTAVTGVYLVA